MALPSLNKSCVQTPDGDGTDVAYDIEARCGGGWVCPSVCTCMQYFYPTGEAGEMCACVTKSNIQTRIDAGWKFKSVFARVDPRLPEIAAFIPSPSPDHQSLIGLLDLYTQEYPQASSRVGYVPLIPTIEPNPTKETYKHSNVMFRRQDPGWVECPEEIRNGCREDAFKTCNFHCGEYGGSSCGSSGSPPTWGCGPQQSDGDIDASMASCGQLVQEWERAACYTTIQEYLECVGRYNVAAQAYNEREVARAACRQREADAVKACKDQETSCRRILFMRCMDASGCEGGRLFPFDFEGPYSFESQA